MKRIKNYLLIGAGFLALSILTGLVTSRPVIAQLIKAALVSSIDEPGRIPYEYASSSTCTPFSGIGCRFTPPTVPAGKRLVVTNLSGQLSVPTLPGQVILINLDSTNNPFVYASLATSYQGSLSGTDFFAFNSAVRAYYDAGSAPAVQFILTNPGILGFSLSGYLIDCTNSPCAAMAP